MNIKPFSSKKQLLKRYGVTKDSELINSEILKEQLDSLKAKNYFLYETSKGNYFLKAIMTNGRVYTLGKDISNTEEYVQSIGVTGAKVKRMIDQKGQVAQKDAETKKHETDARRAEVELKTEEIKKGMIDALHKKAQNMSAKEAYGVQLNILKDALESIITDLNSRNYYHNEKEVMIDIARSQFNKLIKEFVDITGKYPKELDLKVYFNKLKTKSKPLFQK